jgi:hypothetical protein
MSARLQWSGLNEFLREFHALPETLRADGMEIVREETTGAAAELARGYAQKTGALARSVKVEFPSAARLIGIVVNTSPHSHLYDFGTQVRRNRAGANRGRMPAARVMVPIVQRRRAHMTRRLEDLLRQNGFQVGSGV